MPENGDHEALIDFRLKKQEESMTTSVQNITKIQIDLATQNAKLDNMGVELTKITRLMYTVLGAFAVSIATALSKLLFKNGAGVL